MKISQLIAQLEQSMSHFGDAEVEVRSKTGDFGMIRCIGMHPLSTRQARIIVLMADFDEDKEE